jgi:hypothetical protein
VDVAGELGLGGDLTGSSGSAAAAAAWPSSTGAYSSGIAIGAGRVLLPEASGSV